MFELILHTGTTHEQTLSGLGAAGYTWDYIIEGAVDVIDISFKTVKTLNTSLFSSYNNDYIYTITALKQGKVQVKFYLHRIWEHDSPPLRECIINFTVI